MPLSAVLKHGRGSSTLAMAYAWLVPAQDAEKQKKKMKKAAQRASTKTRWPNPRYGDRPSLLSQQRCNVAA